MMDEWISVKEFSERAGISVQAVYKQLNKKLKPYLIVMDGKKMLNIKALEDVYGKTEQQETQPVKQEMNEKLLNQLIAQLEEKDRQINELHRLLASKDMQLTECLHTVQMLEDRQKAEQQEEEEEQKEQEVEPDPTEDEEIKLVSTDSTEKNEKKPWWKRIFGV